MHAIRFRFSSLPPLSLSMPLVIAVCLTLNLAGLANRELWSLESRWANIVLHMLLSHDYWHPVLNGHGYTDKPLLSYWLIVLTSTLHHDLDLFSLRLPSACAGCISAWSCYHIGRICWDTQTGKLSACLLVTCFYFTFWSRVASADSLTVAGTLCAVVWYLKYQTSHHAWPLFMFIGIMSLTSLCKGLLGFVVPLLVLLPLIVSARATHYHRLRLFPLRCSLAAIAGLTLYFMPFILSNATASEVKAASWAQSVFYENIVRFFSPWDHKGPVWLYCIYLPIYLLPWTPLWLWVMWHFCRWPSYRKHQPYLRWLLWAIFSLFLFFTLSGSRRSYYILPLIPFCLILTARGCIVLMNHKRRSLLPYAVLSCCTLMLCNALICTPWYYGGGGLKAFKQKLQAALGKHSALAYTLIQADNKVPLYLPKPASITRYNMQAQTRHHSIDTSEHVIISQASQHRVLRQQFPDYVVITVPPTTGKRLLAKPRDFEPIALIAPSLLQRGYSMRAISANDK